MGKKQASGLCYLLSILILTVAVISGCAARSIETGQEAAGDVNSRIDGELQTGQDGELQVGQGCELQVVQDDKLQAGQDADASAETNSDDDEVANVDWDDNFITEEDQAAVTISIRMVGDVLLHDRLEEAAKQEDGSYKYDFLFREVGDLIADADLAIVNQEVIIAGEQYGISGYPAFNAPFAVADELSEVGFDVVCHGTNHALDKGGKGILSCLDYWDSMYPEMEVTGIHDSAEDAERISYLEVGGITIAVLNYTYGTNGITPPSDMPYAVDYLEEEAVAAALKAAEENADFTIVCPHWGTEYSHEISQSQRKWTEIFCKNGADLVIGTHPHVIEPIEMLEDPETGKEMLVYYSLGNYINWTSGTGAGTADRMLGGMADVELTVESPDESEKRVRISSYGVIPLVSHVTTDPEALGVYSLSDYTEELASENAIRTQDDSFSRDYLVNLSDSIWGEYDLSIQY